MLSSSTQMRTRSFCVVERTRTSSKCQKMKNARAKRAKILFFHCQICKFVGCLLPSSSWLLKAWFPYRCICRICRDCRTKKNHRTDRIHSISYNKLYLSFLLYWAFLREVSIKFYLSYEFFSYDRQDRYDRYNDMETRLKLSNNDIDLIKWGVSFQRNCRAAWVGKWYTQIWYQTTWSIRGKFPPWTDKEADVNTLQ